jgi:hypothetical protein
MQRVHLGNGTADVACSVFTWAMAQLMLHAACSLGLCTSADAWVLKSLASRDKAHVLDYVCALVIYPRVHESAMADACGVRGARSIGHESTVEAFILIAPCHMHHTHSHSHYRRTQHFRLQTPSQVQGSTR